VNGEVNAVNSEYQNDIADSRWKIEFMMKILAKTDHPFGKFNIGE
jgi:secreted Zn-dependent insulinase-like peptidase